MYYEEEYKHYMKSYLDTKWNEKMIKIVREIGNGLIDIQNFGEMTHRKHWILFRR